MIDGTGEYDSRVDPSAHWVLQSLAARQLHPPLKTYANWIPVERVESVLRDKEVQSISLDSDALTAEEAIPPCVRDLPRLRRLTLPSQIASSLSPDHLPGSIKELIFSGSHDKKYRKDNTVVLGRSRPFPSIEHVTGVTHCYRSEARFRFAPTLFPSLLAIGFTFDKRRQFSETLRQLRTLLILSVAAFDSIEELADVLPSEKVISLTLAWNRSITSLGGIERFQNLRFLKVTALTQLRSLDGIQGLAALEYLGINYSKCVQDTKALNALPSLRALSAFSSDNSLTDWKDLSNRIASRYKERVTNNERSNQAL